MTSSCSPLLVVLGNIPTFSVKPKIPALSCFPRKAREEKKKASVMRNCCELHNQPTTHNTEQKSRLIISCSTFLISFLSSLRRPTFSISRLQSAQSRGNVTWNRLNREHRTLDDDDSIDFPPSNRRSRSRNFHSFAAFFFISALVEIGGEESLKFSPTT